MELHERVKMQRKISFFFVFQMKEMTEHLYNVIWLLKYADCFLLFSYWLTDI